MANVAKYTKSTSGHMCAHYERKKDANGEYIKFHNQEIDPKRTHLNYNLAPDHDQIEFIQKRTGEVKCLKRENVNVMCSWVVTVPKDLPSDRHKDFFRNTYEFLAKKYGEENVISAYVHMDEVTPHMHFAFVPVVTDKKKGILKVSAKEAVQRADLEHFHTDLQQYLENTMKCPVNVLNGATKNGAKTVAELKAEEQIKALENDVKREREKKEYYREENRELKEKRMAQKMENNRLEKKISENAKTLEKQGEEMLFNTAILESGKREIENISEKIEELKKQHAAVAAAAPKEKIVEVNKDYKKLAEAYGSVLQSLLEDKKTKVFLDENKPGIIEKIQKLFGEERTMLKKFLSFRTK